MTPARLDRDVVGRRLRALTDALEVLAELRGVTPRRLADQPLTRAAAERLLQVAVDLAIDVNAHVSVALLGRAPSTGRESFALMAEAGALEPALADRLAPAAGLQNVLVHRYVDIRTDLVADAVSQILDQFPGYVATMAAFVEGR